MCSPQTLSAMIASPFFLYLHINTNPSNLPTAPKQIKRGNANTFPLLFLSRYFIGTVMYAEAESHLVGGVSIGVKGGFNGIVYAVILYG